MGVTHKGLIIYLIFSLAVSVLFITNKRLRLKEIFLLLIAIFIVFILKSYLIYIPSMSSSPIFYILSGEGLEYLEERSEKGSDMQGRAQYDARIDSSSASGIVKGIVLKVIYYYYAPFPWRIKNSMDIYASFESIVYTILFVGAFFSMRHEVFDKNIGKYLLVMFIMMSLLFSLGTSNYGTATRHRIVNYWIILLLGAPVIINTLIGIIAKIYQGKQA